MTDFKVNPWVSFLRQYGPIPRNDNMYDETIQRAIRKLRGIRPLRLEIGPKREVLEALRGDPPCSVILTGTAGDGKTYVCREVWTELGGTAAVWDSDVKVRRLDLADGRHVNVVKDLSEFRDGDYGVLANMASAVLSPASRDLFLIAANDGQLVEAWQRAPETPEVIRVRAIIEELLITGKGASAQANIRLHNLSQTDSADLLRKILAEVLAHEGWQQCNGCRGQLEGQANRCPIWENLQRLRGRELADRLCDLLELCDHSGVHLPLRQLLLLTSNALLGHPAAKDGLLQCKQVPAIVSERKAHAGSVYSNIFGNNLSPGRRATTDGIDVLRRFGIGEETSNRVDNLLVFGSDEPRLKPMFDRLIRSDPVYGGHDSFFRLQSAYLEGADPQIVREFLAEMIAQRQRLFFVAPSSDASELCVWDLSVFQFANEYLNHVLRPLRQGARIQKSVTSRLVRGINRVFTGLMTSVDREMVLASSGSYSQARISRIEETFISVDPKLGQRVALELRDGEVFFAVYITDDQYEAFHLNVLRYEFLLRVADGALPSSFSRECYEDLLSFKSRLLRRWGVVSASGSDADETSTADELEVKLLELDARGRLSPHPLTVRRPDSR